MNPAKSMLQPGQKFPLDWGEPAGKTISPIGVTISPFSVCLHVATEEQIAGRQKEAGGTHLVWLKDKGVPGGSVSEGQHAGDWRENSMSFLLLV